jgi:hypothetical protein
VVGLRLCGTKWKRTTAFLFVVLAACWLLNVLVAEGWTYLRPSRHVIYLLVLASIEYGFAFEANRRSGLKHPRLLMVIEDLDRCTVEEVTDVLDTLSTVFRPNPTPATSEPLMPPLCVLVVAHDVWLVDAYNKRHDAPKDSPDGWQFLAKHFDLAPRLPHPTDVDLQKLLGVISSLQEGPKAKSPPAGKFLATDTAVRGPVGTVNVTVPSPDSAYEGVVLATEVGAPANNDVGRAAGSSIEVASAEFEEHLLALNIGRAGRNARAVRRACSHYWFLTGAFPGLPTRSLATACLAISHDPSLVHDRLRLETFLGPDADGLCDALGVTLNPPPVVDGKEA